MEFKKLILFLISCANILQCFGGSTSSKMTYSGDLKLTSENVAKLKKQKDNQTNQCIYRVDKKVLQKELAKHQKEFGNNNDKHQELVSRKNITPEAKAYLEETRENLNHAIETNINKAKEEAKNVMAVLDGREAPIKTYITLAMAQAMAKNKKEILSQCDEKRKKEIKGLYRIANFKFMIEKQIFPEVLPYCADWSCIQTSDEDVNGHIRSIRSLTKLTDNTFASGSDDNTIKIWQLKNGQYECIQTFDENINGHTGIVRSLVELSATSFASGSEDRTIKIWRLHESQYECIQTLDQNINAHTDFVTCLAKLTATSFASGSDDHTIKIWQLRNGQYECIQTLDENINGHTDRIRSLAELTATSFASGSWDYKIKIWQLKNGRYQCIQTLDKKVKGDYNLIKYLTKLTEDTFASCSLAHTIKIWQLKNGKYECIQTLEDQYVDCLIKLTETSFASGLSDDNIQILHLNILNQEMFLRQKIKVERKSVNKSKFWF